MTVNTLDIESSVLTGPFILACGHCNWTSLEIDMQFDRVTNIWGQIALKNRSFPNTLSPSARAFFMEQASENNPGSGPEAVFAALKSFHSSQLSASDSTNPLLTPSGGFNYNSPSSLARIMSLYTGVGAPGKKSTEKPQIMRESADPSEGLHVTDVVSDANEVQRLREQGWAGTTSTAQRNSQPQNPRFVSDLLPVPTLLRTKRSKRCGTCRHILVKPEPKVQSTRFKIKLIAISYIPTITLKTLPPSPSQPAIDFNAIRALRPSQFLLTLKNSLFDALRVTLATPPHTPGPHAHKVTILCPQFEIGPNADLWDEALNGGVTTDDKARTRQNRRLRENNKSKFTDSIMGSEGGVAEAGKVWDRGRNWTTVVLEVVCEDVQQDEERGLTEDEDVLEIPILVRMEWDGDAGGDGGLGVERGTEKRELAYWVVIGVGRIAAVK